MRCSDRLYSQVSILFCGVLFPPVQCSLYLNISHTIRLCSCGMTPGLFSIAVYSRILVYPCLPSQKKKTPGTYIPGVRIEKEKRLWKRLLLLLVYIIPHCYLIVNIHHYTYNNNQIDTHNNPTNKSKYYFITFLSVAIQSSSHPFPLNASPFRFRTDRS